jgi:FkbM family methyltransferase
MLLSVKQYHLINQVFSLNMGLKNFIKLLCQKTFGFKTYLYFFSLFTINRLKYEQEFQFFSNMIKEGGIVLDIGANIGMMTAAIAQKLKTSKVYAFEPIPENIKTLKRVVNHYKLDNVKIYEAALGEESGELKMVMPVINNVKMQGLSHVLEEGAHDKSSGNVYVVPVKKLDEIAELHTCGKITAIKIDVENFEYHVLKGGEQLLIKHKPIIYCELWNNDRKTMTIDYLNNLGYKVKIYDNDQLIDYTGQEAINFFFIPIHAN